MEPGKRISWYLIRAEGSDDKHCRKWRIVLRFPYDRLLKRRPTRSFTFHGPKTAAAKEAQRRAVDAEDGRIVVGSGITVEQFAREWASTRLAKKAIAKDTYDKQVNLINALCMHIGPMRVRDVTAADVDAVYRALSSGDSPSGRPWSGTSLHSLHSVLLPMFASACSQGVIGLSPMAGVEAPRVDTRERRALSLAQATELLDALDVSDERQWCAWLMLATGMRSEEALRVRFSDISDGVLSIPRSGTKTDAGARLLPLDDAVMGKVDERISCIACFAEGLPLVCDSLGNPVSYNKVRKWWNRNRARFGMDDWTLHELRHTFASNLAEAKVEPKVMQKLMGHASEATTLKIYTHVRAEQQAQAMRELSQARENLRESC